VFLAGKLRFVLSDTLACIVQPQNAPEEQGEPPDAFCDHCKANEGLHITYNNTGLISKASKEIATENVLSYRVEYGWDHEQKICNISETVQDRTKVTMTD